MQIRKLHYFGYLMYLARTGPPPIRVFHRIPPLPPITSPPPYSPLPGLSVVSPALFPMITLACLTPHPGADSSRLQLGYGMPQPPTAAARLPTHCDLQ